MNQSKLIVLLRTIPGGKLNRFREFLASPYFNKNEDQVRFFRYLQKNLPQDKEDELKKERVLEKLKLSKPVDEKRLAYLMNVQLGLLEKFLSIERFLADEFGQQLINMQEYHDLQLPKHYKSAATKAQKMIRHSPHRNAAFFHRDLLFKSLQYEHSDLNLRTYDESLQANADALDAYFLLEKLRLACTMTNLKNILNIEYRMPFMEQVMEWSAGDPFSAMPTIQIYRRTLRMLRNPDDQEGFTTLKNLLIKNKALLNEPELKQLFTLLLNHCTYRINRLNDKQSLSEYFDINKLLLENGLIFEQGFLQPWRFANLVHIGLRLGQTEWVHRFIHQYKDKLPAAYAENMLRYNLALYHYHLGQPAEAQQELLRVDTAEDVLLNISSRSLLIKIYYKTEQWELLHSFLEATRIFLHRNTLLDRQRQSQMQKFIAFTMKIARLESFEKEKLQKLKNELPPAAGILHRDWIQERIEEKLIG